jgi:PPOX class probable F420-dependent enzyme
MAATAGDLARNISKLLFRGMDAIRHRDAFSVDVSVAGGDFTGFRRSRQILLVTFRRSGEAVPSPINHGLADGKLYVRTDATSAKVKRLQNNPSVVVVPCSFRGRPKGQPVGGRARILPESECSHADQVIAANWSPPMKLFERSLDKGGAAVGIATAYIEITPG